MLVLIEDSRLPDISCRGSVMRHEKLRRFLEGYKDKFMIQTVVGTTRGDTDGSSVHWEKGPGMWQLLAVWAIAAMEQWI